MVELASNFAAVRERIAAACRAVGRDAADVDLLAVSKRHPAELVRAAMACGQRAFGENRVQELVQKADELRDVDGLAWHLIGSLQTNKVRELVRVPRLALLHSLDRRRLADALQRELAQVDGTLDVLLQINATGEDQKHGCLPEDAAALLVHCREDCDRLRVVGMMAMGPLVGDPAPVFEAVVRLRDQLRKSSGLALSTLSLGMSGDLEAAVAAGSTMVRIGTALFGERD